MKKQTIALFMGSFNPIHLGHLIIGNLILEQVKFDCLRYVVSPQNPFKEKKDLLAVEERIKMVDLAVARKSNLESSDAEVNLPIPSYTIDTIEYLEKKYPNENYQLVMGSDNLYHFHKWKKYADLEKRGILVYPRLGYTDGIEEFLTENIKILDLPIIEISATMIRNKIKNQQSISYLVTSEVEAHIEKLNLYR